MMAGLGVLVGALLAFAGPVGWSIGWACAAALLLTGFGNILNDLRDVDIDRVAHPNRPLASGRIRTTTAGALGLALLVLGLASAYAARGLATLAFATIVAMLLWTYETALKHRGLTGNLAIAALTASTFLFGGVAMGIGWTDAGAIAVIALMAFFVNAGREVLKDVEDQGADRGRRTLPMRVGVRTATRTAVVLVALGIIASLPMLIQVTFLFVPAGPMLLAADGVLVWACTWASREPAKSQRMLKLGMAVAILSFLAAGIAQQRAALDPCLDC